MKITIDIPVTPTVKQLDIAKKILKAATWKAKRDGVFSVWHGAKFMLIKVIEQITEGLEREKSWKTLSEKSFERSSNLTK